MKTLLFTILAVMMTVPAMAGTVVVVETKLVGGAASGTTRIYLDKDQLRIDTDEQNSYSVIYRLQADGEPMYYVIDNGTKTFVQLNQENLDVMRQRAETAKRELQRQLDELPYTERQQLEQMYRSQIEAIGLNANRVKYKKVSEGARVGKWKCDHYQGYEGETKKEEAWVTGWKELGLRESEMVAFGRLTEALDGIGVALPAFFHFARKDAGGSGFPVMVVTYDDGNRREQSELVEVRQEQFDAQLFELPEGLTPRAPGR